MLTPTNWPIWPQPDFPTTPDLGERPMKTVSLCAIIILSWCDVLFFLSLAIEQPGRRDSEAVAPSQ
jgi:hypothetical protein